MIDYEFLADYERNKELYVQCLPADVLERLLKKANGEKPEESQGYVNFDGEICPF